MNITKEFIKKVVDTEEKIIENNEKLSKTLPFVKAGNGKTIHKIIRDEKEIEIAEETLWVEVYHLGLNCPAGAILKPLYPEIFKLTEESDKLKVDIQKTEIEAMGFSFKEMTSVKLIKLIVEIVKNIKSL